MIVIVTILTPLILFIIMIVSLNGVIVVIYFLGYAFILISFAILIVPLILFSFGCVIGMVVLFIIFGFIVSTTRAIRLVTSSILSKLLTEIKLRTEEKQQNNPIIKHNSDKRTEKEVFGGSIR